MRLREARIGFERTLKPALGFIECAELHVRKAKIVQDARIVWPLFERLSKMELRAPFLPPRQQQRTNVELYFRIFRGLSDGLLQ